MQAVVLKPFVHRNAEVIGIDAPYLREFDIAIRKLKGVKWSQSNKLWYLPLAKESHLAIKAGLQSLATVDESLLKTYLQKREIIKATASITDSNKNRTGGPQHPVKPPALTTAWKIGTENLAALNRFLEQLKLKAYSASTVKTYRNEFLQLLQVLKQKAVTDLTPDDLRRYFVYCLEKLKLSENTLHSRINAVKFYFEQVLGREKFFWEIPRPKKAEKLPPFFNREEVAGIMNGVENVKHKALLMLAYGSGLRVSDVTGLKTKNVDGQRMSILVEGAKGKKDRMVELSPVLLMILRRYAAEFKPDRQGYLFEGAEKGRPYAARSLQEVLHSAKKKHEF